MTYEVWIARVNKALNKRIGVTTEDVDASTSCLFEQGMEPNEAAELVIEEWMSREGLEDEEWYR